MRFQEEYLIKKEKGIFTLISNLFSSINLFKSNTITLGREVYHSVNHTDTITFYLYNLSFYPDILKEFISLDSHERLHRFIRMTSRQWRFKRGDTEEEKIVRNMNAHIFGNEYT